jgi:hypothetical protein
MEGTGTGETTAPVTTTPTAPAAAPVVTPTVGSGTPAPATETKAPTSMAEGFAQLAEQTKADPNPAPVPATDGTLAEPVVEPAPPAAAAKPAKPQGPIPFAQHKAAVDNARAKGAEEALSQHWSREYRPEQVQKAMELVQAMRADLPGFTRQLVSELQADPRYRTQIQAQRQAAQGPPPPDMVTADGSTKFYSEKGTQALVNYHVQRAIQQVTEQLGQRIAPIEQDRQTREAEAQRTATVQRAEAEITEYETKPLFKENLPAILAEMEKDGRLGLAGAYARVVVPQLTPQKTAAQVRAEERAAIMREIENRTGAGSLNPSAPSAARVGPTKFRSTKEGFQQGFQQLAGKF